MKVRCPYCHLEFEVGCSKKIIKRVVVPKQPQPMKYSDPLGRKLIGKKIDRSVK